MAKGSSAFQALIDAGFTVEARVTLRVRLRRQIDLFAEVRRCEALGIGGSSLAE